MAVRTMIPRAGRIKSIKVPPVALQASTTGYDATGSGVRTMSWPASSGGANWLWQANAESLRMRARDLVRRDPWARKAVAGFVGNLIGRGIRPQPRHPDPAISQELLRIWKKWCKEADADGCTTLYGLQAMAERARFEGGETFIRFRPRREEDGLTVPLQLQLLESEQVPTSLHTTTPTRGRIRMGIETNVVGRRTAYHMHREHPGDVLLSNNGTEIRRVPASEVIHYYRPDRLGQIRGFTDMSALLALAHDIHDFNDAERVRKKLAAMMVGFVTHPPQEGRGAYAEGEPNAAGVAVAPLQPGMMQKLQPGWDVKFNTPAEVGNSYDPFMVWQMHSYAAGAGVSYESLTGDLRQVNFSSIRAGLIEVRRIYKQLQDHHVVPKLAQAIWDRFVETAALAGVIDARRFQRERDDFLDVNWIPDGWDWVDPEKEEKAKRMAVRSGFTSRRRVVAERGATIEEVDKEIEEDNERTDERELVLDSDPRRTTASGGKQGSGAPAPPVEPAAEDDLEDDLEDDEEEDAA